MEHRDLLLVKDLVVVRVVRMPHHRVLVLVDLEEILVVLHLILPDLVIVMLDLAVVVLVVLE